MNRRFENTRFTVISQLYTRVKSLIGLLAVVAILCIVSCTETDQPNAQQNIEPALDQAVFAAPEDVANAFTLALENNDTEMLSKLLGTGYHDFLPVDEVDAEDIANFVTAWDKTNTLLPQGGNKMLIAVGEDEWTFPIPIAEGATGWYFDIEEGLERMRIRRIGRNEISAMQVVLAYYDAQMEYARQDHNGNGMLEYAQQFISTSGTRDGLFWEDEAGDTISPLGPLMADLTPGGGYFGYYYRILNVQGADAMGGAYSYMMGDKMRAGFALIAWPEEYGESGVMSFIVSHSGIVYEQNLGPDGAEMAEAMSSYNPDENWIPVQEVNGPQNDTAQ